MMSKDLKDLPDYHWKTKRTKKEVKVVLSMAMETIKEL